MMAFHTILRTSVDYYSALAKARELTDSITASININRTAEEQVTVFPYSVFYVFYEQYLTMWEDTLTSLGISLGAIFVVTFSSWVWTSPQPLLSSSLCSSSL